MKTLLEELDTLIATQAKLQFSQHNYDEAAADAYGLALLDFIRARGVELRSALAASPAPAQQAVTDEMVERGARVIAKQCREDYDFVGGFAKSAFRDRAQAVIAAALTTTAQGDSDA